MKTIPLLALAAAALLAACAAPPPPQQQQNAAGAAPRPAGKVEGARSGTLDLIRAQRLIARTLGDIPTMLHRHETDDPQFSRRVRIGDVDYFQMAPEGQRYAQSRGHRALAIGVPRDRCPHYEVVVDAESSLTAIGDALESCVADLGLLPRSKDDGCGCQVVAYDGALLVQPTELPYRERLQTHLLWRDGEQGAFRRQVAVGELRELPSGSQLSVTDVRGAQICSGTLMPSGPGRGTMELSCEGITGRLTGSYTVEGHRQGRDFGIAYLRAGSTRAAFLLGYSEEEFQEARTPVMSRLSNL